MSVVLFFLAWTFAHASTLDVQDGLRTYKLEYRKDLIKLSSRGINLQFEKKTCNELLMTNFANKMEMLFTKSPMFAGASPEAVNFKLDGVSFYEGKATARGKTLAQLPFEVKRLKVEETLVCQPKRDKN